MKKVRKEIIMNPVRSVVMLAGAALFTFLLISFNYQSVTQEKLLGLTFDEEKKEVTINVTSTGCTDKSYFQFKVRGAVIEIIRLKRDECKRMPFATSFTYSMAEAGIQPNKVYVIKNKFTASPDLANMP
ncbi:MAG TPA: hypothetical protein VFV31_12280 [Chitinophagaceae bacterium]|nr:hypothetical protein [Chitinophagaceae bacterium]